MRSGPPPVHTLSQPHPPTPFFQQIIREFEGHLRAVAGERDSALGLLQGAEAAQEDASRRLREAERKEVRWRRSDRGWGRVGVAVGCGTGWLASSGKTKASALPGPQQLAGSLVEPAQL